MNDHTPSPVYVDAMETVCEDTQHGWPWYCDVHDTHGNADQEEEARVIAEAHSAFYSEVDDGKPCDIVIWLRTRNERLRH